MKKILKRQLKPLLKEFGHVDIWVNNAGVEASFPTIDMPLKEWQRVIDVNLNGVFLGSREALRIFRDQKSKVQSLICPPYTKEFLTTFAHYAASKGATEMFTKTIALEYAEYGIRANCIAL